MTCCDTTKGYLPGETTAGLNFQARVSLQEYPAPAWAANLFLRGPVSVDLTASADGDAHVFSAAGAVTSDWTDGMYWYALRVTNGADVVEIETGSIRVLPDLAAADAGFDGRTKAQIALDAINAVIDQRASLDQERYRINNRELYRTSITDLLKLRSFYVSLVNRERNCKSGRSPFGRIRRIKFS